MSRMSGRVSTRDIILTGSIGVQKEINLDELTATENGEYEPSEEYDGFSKVTVEVPIPVLDDITITENGHYTPPEGVGGYDDITVNVPAPAPKLLHLYDEVTENGNHVYIPSDYGDYEGFSQVNMVTNVPIKVHDKTFTANGVYPPEANYDGYATVTVNVPTSPVLDDITITQNGTYTPPTGVDGYDEVVVNVPATPAAILPLNIIDNGTYEAPTGLDGYNPISVNVPIPADENLYVELNGVYHPTSPDHRIYQVTVNVPSITMLAKRLQLTNEYGTSLGKVSTDSNFTAGKYYYFLIYNTTSTENINQQGLVLCPAGNFSVNGQTIYVGSYEMLAYPDGVRMVTNPGSEKYVVIFEVPDTALTS